MQPLPFLSTGVSVIDDAFRVALGDLLSNVGKAQKGLLTEPSPVIHAGLRYKDAWTRDAAINAWNNASLLLPEASRNTLLSVLAEKEGEPVIGGELGQYWDAIIWTLGAWQQYLVDGDSAFLELALNATANSLKYYEATEFDETLNLFRGPACYGDGISAYPDVYAKGADGPGYIKRWPKRFPELAAKKGYGLPMHSLSTNCLYYGAYITAGKMAREIGLGPDPEWEKRARELKKAINRQFWMAEKGTYRYLVDPFGNSDVQEGMGLGFALLLGVADSQQAASVLKNQHITAFGIPCLWPCWPRYRKPGADTYGRHSGTVWPHIQGFWAEAALKNGRSDLFEKELFVLASQAVKYGQYHEIYHPVTGEPYGGEQENRVECAPRQTWCATTFLRMVFTGVCGFDFQPHGIAVRPRLPEGCERLEMENLPYRDASIRLVIKGRGSRAASFRINGVQQADAFIPATLNGTPVVEVVLAGQ